MIKYLFAQGYKTFDQMIKVNLKKYLKEIPNPKNKKDRYFINNADDDMTNIWTNLISSSVLARMTEKEHFSVACLYNGRNTTGLLRINNVSNIPEEIFPKFLYHARRSFAGCATATIKTRIHIGPGEETQGLVGDQIIDCFSKIVKHDATNRIPISDNLPKTFLLDWNKYLKNYLTYIYKGSLTTEAFKIDINNIHKKYKTLDVFEYLEYLGARFINYDRCDSKVVYYDDTGKENELRGRGLRDVLIKLGIVNYLMQIDQRKIKSKDIEALLKKELNSKKIKAEIKVSSSKSELCSNVLEQLIGFAEYGSPWSRLFNSDITEDISHLKYKPLWGRDKLLPEEEQAFSGIEQSFSKLKKEMKLVEGFLKNLANKLSDNKFGPNQEKADLCEPLLFKFDIKTKKIDFGVLDKIESCIKREIDIFEKANPDVKEKKEFYKHTISIIDQLLLGKYCKKTQEFMASLTKVNVN
ncbi:hypothetical protein ACFLZV_03275 [Candidatus Margulisiibacteriota bacterium]